MRGRKPEPAELHRAKGNPGKRTRSSARVALISDGVSPPKWLKKCRRAAEVWSALAPILQRINALAPQDQFPLARYCRFAAEWIAADEDIRLYGTWYDGTDSNEAPKKYRHPVFGIWMDLDKRLSELEAAFGMRPDARWKMLRDQAAVAGLGIGGLFDREPTPSPEQAPDASKEPAANPIGSLNLFDSPAPGSLPN